MRQIEFQKNREMHAFVGVEKKRGAIEIPTSFVYPMVVQLKLILRIDLHVICDMNGATLGKSRFPGVGIDALGMKILFPQSQPVVATRKCRINCNETLSPPYRLSRSEERRVGKE